ncbi:MAG: hypothetical protein WB392_07700 [Methanotrichaceae archaeon]
MNTKQEFGGVNQSSLVLSRIKRSAATIKIKSNVIHIALVVLLALLLVSINGIGLAQMSRDNPEPGNDKVVNASAERSTIYWIEAQPNGMPIENSDQLFQISGGWKNIQNAIQIPGDELISYKPSTVTGTGAPEPPEGDIVICLFNGRGFALKGNETHVLRMNVELIRDIDPTYLRDLMTSNKSIEAIKEGLNAKEGNASLRGSLRINESSYSLLNIKLVPYQDNATIVDADVAKLYLKPAPGEIMRPDASDRTAVAGHIKVTVAPSEGGLVGKGEITMGSDEYNGKYNVFLHMEKPMPCDILPPKGSSAPPVE